MSRYTVAKSSDHSLALLMNEVVDLYLGGLSVADAASLAGVSGARARQMLGDAACAIRGPGATSKVPYGMRSAKCGHMYRGPLRAAARAVCDECFLTFEYPCGHVLEYRPNHNSGPSRLPPCRECLDTRPCLQCGKSLTGRRACVKFCDVFCSNVFRGAVRAEPLPPIVCALPDCDVEFVPVADKTRCCCEDHGKKLWHIEAKRDGRVKKQPWNDARRDSYHRRRARIKDGERVLLADIIERDQATCGICRKKVDLSLVHPDPMSRSLDHIVPLSKGGTHDPANVQLAHLVCNVSKGNRGGGEQLRLVG